jgi:hypothetical protein
MRPRDVAAAALLGLVAVGCGGGPDPTQEPTTANPRCAELAQEVTDAYNRGDTQAQRAAEDEFDRLTEAGECD